MENGGPKKLNLVKLDGPLGDLSGMTAAERAELVQQDGRRRIFEEIAQAEMEAWRRFFLWGGIAAGGCTLAVATRIAVGFLWRSATDFPEAVWMLLRVVLVGAAVVGVAAILPAVWCFAKLLVAMHRRRRLGRSGVARSGEP